MKKLALILSSVMLASVGSAAYATEVSVTVTPPENPGQVYTLRLYSKDSDGTIVYYDEAVSDTSGVSFTFDFGGKSGKYPYIIQSDTERWSEEGTIIFVNEDELQAAMEEFKKAFEAEDKTAAIKQVLQKYSEEFKLEEDFAINEEIEKLDTSTAYARIANNLTAESDGKEIQRVYRESMLLLAAEKGSSDLIVKMNDECAALLGLDNAAINSEYAGMSVEVKKKTADIERGKYNSLAEYVKAHGEAVALTAINESSSWQMLGEKIQSLNEAAGLGYVKSSNENDVLHKLVSKKPFSSLSDFETKHKAAISEANNTGSGGNGGSGGGPSRNTGSGSGGSVSVDLGNLPAVTNKGFTDMGAYAWAKDAVDSLAEKGIISGRSADTFAPGDYITREEFAKIIASAFLQGKAGSAEFSDVVPGAWYEPYIGAAYAANVVSGLGDGSFGVGKYITRQDAAVMLVRAAGAKTAGAEPVSADRFNDSGRIAEYARESVEILVGMSVVSGTPEGDFLPENPITRAETARMVYSMLGA